MGQGLFEQLVPVELVTDDVSKLLRRQNPSLPTLALVHAVEQPTIANRKRPFPELPQPRRSVGRKEDELGPSDQVLGWDVADGGQHAAVLRVVAIVTHHEVVAGRYVIDL